MSKVNWSDYGIGGIWQSARNDNMLSGKLNFSRLDETTRDELITALQEGGDVRVVIWKNTKKGPDENTPDFRVHAGMPEGDERNTSESSQPAAASNAGADVPF